MKEMLHMDKICGVLRVSCGVLFGETPQDNIKSDSVLERLRGFAGYFFYLRTCARARAHAHTRARMRVVRRETPQNPATRLNSLFDSELTCGVWAFGNPAETPQMAPGNPANGRRQGEDRAAPDSRPQLHPLSRLLGRAERRHATAGASASLLVITAAGSAHAAGVAS